MKAVPSTRLQELDGTSLSGLHDVVLAALQAVHTYGASVPLETIELNVIDFIEREAAREPEGPFAEWAREIRRNAMAYLAAIENYDAMRALADAVAEARLFLALAERLPVERVPKAKVDPTPDFKVPTANGHVFIEAKTPDVAMGSEKHRQIMNEGLDAKIDLANQLAHGKRLAITERVVAPYEQAGLDYNPRSRRMVIETLIVRGRRLATREQFSHGPTVLLLNLDRLPIMGNAGNGLMDRAFIDQESGVMVSGILWHVAFGRAGDPIRRVPEFDGISDDDDGALGLDGILLARGFVPAILFYVHSNFYAAIRRTTAGAAVRSLVCSVAADTAEA